VQAPLFYAFPTLEQLAAATEEELRAAGFGYRAKFVVESVAQLRAQPGGGAAWLQGLRDVPYSEAAEALCTLPGIGPKVWPQWFFVV
jgi:N-glycosylase/DNA lyase